MNKKKIKIIFILFISFVIGKLCFAQISIKEYEQAMSQRASFILEGKIIDENGNQLNNVSIKIVLSQFIPKTLSHKEEVKNFIVNGEFKYKYKNISNIKIYFTKDGYYPEDIYVSHSDSFKIKEKEIHAKLLSKQIDPKNYEKEMFKYYKNSEYIDKNIIIKLIKRKGNLARIIRRVITIDVNSKQKKLGDSFKDYAESGEQDFYINYEENDKNKEIPFRLFITTPKEGGIILTKNTDLEFDKMYMAPLEGYNQSIEIFKKEKGVFYLKTSKGFYVKGKYRVLYYNPEKKEASFTIVKSAIQLDGTRNLGTIEER